MGGGGIKNDIYLFKDIILVWKWLMLISIIIKILKEVWIDK